MEDPVQEQRVSHSHAEDSGFFSSTTRKFSSRLDNSMMNNVNLLVVGRESTKKMRTADCF
ncbi:hypothetical protein KIN20_006133 [Parelaphostrongylus tenuis]|uniref:Uncharacterized protein n=1 Tax=Parelaphostrongylus tenuis TaxID=148309 RepID=A0AAD5M365_PARTN|nr:hypothetical protein KIN20_006133 [Parelaphostrongylus tenuis]